MICVQGYLFENLKKPLHPPISYILTQHAGWLKEWGGINGYILEDSLFNE